MHFKTYIKKLTLSSTGWNQYEHFCLAYLKLEPGINDGWLWSDIPIAIKRQLQLLGGDDGFDGLLHHINGDYIPFQVKFTSYKKYLSSSCGVKSAIARQVAFWRHNPNFAHVKLIVISNYIALARNTILHHMGVKWIFYQEQDNWQGDTAVKLVLNKPVIVPQRLNLHPHQVDDLQLVLNHFNQLSPGEYQRVLFRAVMGYGKSICIAHWLYMWFRFHPSFTAIVVLPTLKLVEQMRLTLHEYYFNTDFAPTVYAFASSESTSTKDVLTLSFNLGPNIILTTYKSYHKMRKLLQPNTVIFDEVHRFNDWIPNDPVHYLGFTATPTADTLTHLTQVVNRSLTWAVRYGHLVDYRLNAFVVEPAVEPNQNIETTKLNLYVNLITKILTYNHHLLVVCDSTLLARNISHELNRLNIVAEAITSEISGSHRDQLEARLKQASTSVLVSVRIYREGADLPFLDSVLILSPHLDQIACFQTIGRALRLCQNKTLANIYFPILTPNLNLDDQVNDYTSMINFISYLADNEPDSYEQMVNSVGPDNTRSLQVLMVPTGGWNRVQSGNELVQPNDINNEINLDLAKQLLIVSYHRSGRYLATLFNPTWLNVVIVGILQLHVDGVIRPSQLTSKGKALHQYILKNGGNINPEAKTPHATISRTLTYDLRVWLHRIRLGYYQVDVVGLERKLCSVTIPAELKNIYGQ